jgi:hypothetical protein
MVLQKWVIRRGGLASRGARSPAKNLNFRAGFYATEGNSTGVTWSEVGFKLKTT